MELKLGLKKVADMLSWSSHPRRLLTKPGLGPLYWLLMELEHALLTHRSVYAFDNCILRSGPRDNAHVDIGYLYMEFTN